MRRRPLTAFAALALCLIGFWFGAAGLARAADTDDAVCAAYRSNWEAVRSGGNLAAMTSAANSISAECPTLKRQALAAAAALRRPVEHRPTAPGRAGPSTSEIAAGRAAAADDAAFSMAQSINTAAAYQAYRSNYPDGRHIADADAALQPPPTPTPDSSTASNTVQHISIVVCNKAKTDISVALVYDPVGELVSWRYVGWFVIHPTECNSLEDTDNQLFFLYAKGTDGTTWGNKNLGSDAPQNHCLVADAAYDFMIKSADTTCPANAVAEPFFTVHSTVSSGQYTFNFVLDS